MKWADNVAERISLVYISRPVEWCVSIILVFYICLKTLKYHLPLLIPDGGWTTIVLLKFLQWNRQSNCSVMPHWRLVTLTLIQCMIASVYTYRQLNEARLNVITELYIVIQCNIISVDLLSQFKEMFCISKLRKSNGE